MFARALSLPAPRPSAPRLPALRPWVVAALALWLLAVGYGLRDPWPADEPRFALIAEDMAQTGRWWLPHRGPELYAEKPPVFLWALAAARSLTGSTRSAFLLPSLLAGLTVLWLVHDLLRRLHGRRIALWGTLALLFSLQFTLQARTAQIDMLLVAFTTLSLYGLLRHLLLGPAWGWYTLAGLSAGVGVITKGTGFLPWLILLPYALARWRNMHGLAHCRGGWRWALGPLALLVPILLWALPLLWWAAQAGNAEVAAYRDDLLWRQTVVRYSQAWHHLKPFWYYLVEVIPLLWLPPALLLPWALPAWWRRIRRGQALPLLLLGWIALVLLFFSLSPGKRGVYILPALPALTIALAPLLPGLLRRREVQAALRWLALAISGLLFLASLWALLGAPPFAQRLLQQNGVAPWHWLLPTALLGLLATLAFWRRGMFGFGAVMLLLWSAIGLLGHPDMDAARSGRALMTQVATLLPAQAAVGIVGGPEQFLLQGQLLPEIAAVRAFGYRTPLQRQRQLAESWLREAPGRFVLIQRSDKDDCIDPARAIEVGWSNRRHWYLIDATALRADCQLPAAPDSPLWNEDED